MPLKSTLSSSSDIDKFFSSSIMVEVKSIRDPHYLESGQIHDRFYFDDGSLVLVVGHNSLVATGP